MANFQMGSPSIPVLSETGGTVSLESVNIQSSVTFPAGHVLQVKQFIYSGTTSFTSSGGYVSILSGTVTPVKENSNFLISMKMRASHTQSNSLFFTMNINGNRNLYARDSTYPSATGSIYMEGYGSNHSANAQIDEYNGEYLYSHTGTVNVVVSIEGKSQGGTAYMNKSYSYDDSARGRPISTLIISEIST